MAQCKDCKKLISYYAHRCAECEGKRHSERIKYLFKIGHYKNRDLSYITVAWKKKMKDSLKKAWSNGLFTQERNDKIGKANKGNHNCGKTGRHYYKHLCRVCKTNFYSKRASRTICSRIECQKQKYELFLQHKQSIKTRLKISKALKGKMPKNLEQNQKLVDSPPQRKMFRLIKKLFPSAKYNFYLKTLETKRFLDTAIIEYKIDFEYDGKIHLSKHIKRKDNVRDEELVNMGWTVYRFNKNNILNLEDILSKIVDKASKIMLYSN